MVFISLDHLAEAFAQLDSPDRSRSIAAATMQNNPTPESASHSTIDKTVRPSVPLCDPHS
jgi:hypothetical protein